MDFPTITFLLAVLCMIIVKMLSIVLDLEHLNVEDENVAIGTVTGIIEKQNNLPTISIKHNVDRAIGDLIDNVVANGESIKLDAPMVIKTDSLMYTNFLENELHLFVDNKTKTEESSTVEENIKLEETDLCVNCLKSVELEATKLETAAVRPTINKDKTNRSEINDKISLGNLFSAEQMDSLPFINEIVAAAAAAATAVTATTTTTLNSAEVNAMNDDTVNDIETEKKVSEQKVEESLIETFNCCTIIRPIYSYPNKPNFCKGKF